MIAAEDIDSGVLEPPRHVDQFPGVSGPVVREENRLRARIQLDFVIERLLEEHLRQHEDVLGAFSKGWYRDVQPCQPVEEVLAQRRIPRWRGQLRTGVGTCKHADIGSEFLISCNPAIGATLKNTQQRGLKDPRSLIDGIEQEGTATSGVEKAGTLPVGAGESTASVPEEFHLDQLLWNRAAM